MKTKSKTQARAARLLPGGVPRYVRCYDNGGKSADRYTVCYTGRTATERAESYANHYPYRAMSECPFHPQGVGIWGSNAIWPIDTLRVPKQPGQSAVQRPPAIGRKCHLGKRISFVDLPADCRKLVLRDYREIWGLD